MLTIRITQWFLLNLRFTSLKDFFLNWNIQIGQLTINLNWRRPEKLFISWRQRHLDKSLLVWGYWERTWAFLREPNSGFSDRWHGEWALQEIQNSNYPKPKVFELTFPSLRYSSLSYNASTVFNFNHSKIS